LTGETPLGRIVRIRSEKDSDRIKHFGDHEKQIRGKWLAFRNNNPSKEWTDKDKHKVAEHFEKLFSRMFS